MKCANCPLYSSWNNESDKGESCGLFGDSWDGRKYARVRISKGNVLHFKSRRNRKMEQEGQ